MLPSERLRQQARIAEALARQVSILTDRKQLQEQAQRLHAAADVAERDEASEPRDGSA
jgi:hypothetical protein